MASEYRVGMVAKLLGGGESSSGGELANFFSSPSKVTSSAPSRPTARKSEKARNSLTKHCNCNLYEEKADKVTWEFYSRVPRTSRTRRLSSVPKFLKLFTSFVLLLF